jgi:hypothetical protein
LSESGWNHCILRVAYGDCSGYPFEVKAPKFNIFNFTFPENALFEPSMSTSIVIMFEIAENIVTEG